MSYSDEFKRYEVDVDACDCRVCRYIRRMRELEANTEVPRDGAGYDRSARPYSGRFTSSFERVDWPTDTTNYVDRAWRLDFYGDDCKDGAD